MKPGIIKIKVSGNQRNLQLIPDITKTESSNCFIYTFIVLKKIMTNTMLKKQDSRQAMFLLLCA